jgi:hypothetical protein
MLQALHDQRTAVDLLIQTNLNNINTCVLAKIATVTSGEKKVEVEILSKRSYIDENNVRQYVQLQNIPVRLAYMKGFVPTTKVGDYGLLIVSQTSIEPFLSGKPDSPRKYDLLDGFFIPLVYADEPNTDNVLISSATGEDVKINSGKDLDLTVTGALNITKGASELVSILSNLADTCANITVNTTTGVLNPGSISALQAIRDQIQAFTS